MKTMYSIANTVPGSSPCPFEIGGAVDLFHYSGIFRRIKTRSVIKIGVQATKSPLLISAVRKAGYK